MSFSLRTRLGAVAFGLLIAGCPSSNDSQDTPSTEDGGLTEGGPGPLGDGAAADAAADTCGRLTVACKDGQKCEGAPDCASKVCREGICQTVAPADGTKNGDETDVDCGGSKAPACPTGKGCVIGADCSSSVCKAGVCQAPSPTDGVKNGDETGKDCGGAAAPKCAAGEGCLSDNDCDKVKCDLVQKKCLPASHTDGIKNLDETGIDCGGPTGTVPRCAPGQGCAITTDCANVLCNAGKTCDPPAKDDGLKNGTETDVDCGGGAPTNAAACPVGKACALPADCGTTACNYAKKCVEAPSCNVQYGGDTCGKGEVGQAGAAHESCCKSVLLPNASARVDKYEITAGRMREFIRAVNNDVQTWVVNNRGLTQQIADNMVQYLPTGLKTPTHPMQVCQANGTNCVTDPNAEFGVLHHLGNNVFMPDRPCQNCGQGCYIGAAAGGNGHPTYYWDDNTQDVEFGSLHRVFSKDQLDVKSLNCAPQLLFAAFCAWDGGRLPTQVELGSVNGAWGPDGMPWGGVVTSYRDTVGGAAAPEARRIVYPFLMFAPCSGQGAGGNCFTVPMFEAGAAGTIIYHPEAATQNTTNFNPFDGSPGVFSARYAYPIPMTAAGVHLPATNDQAYAVAAPGRMRNDFRFVGPGADDGYYDIAANVIEATATITGTDNANHNGWPVAQWVGGSFEGHGPDVRGGYDLSVLTKYGKQGARCARAP